MKHVHEVKTSLKHNDEQRLEDLQSVATLAKQADLIKLANSLNLYVMKDANI
jgi:hypothetical protein